MTHDDDMTHDELDDMLDQIVRYARHCRSPEIAEAACSLFFVLIGASQSTEHQGYVAMARRTLHAMHDALDPLKGATGKQGAQMILSQLTGKDDEFGEFLQ